MVSTVTSYWCWDVVGSEEGVVSTEKILSKNSLHIA